MPTSYPGLCPTFCHNGIHKTLAAGCHHHFAIGQDVLFSPVRMFVDHLDDLLIGEMAWQGCGRGMGRGGGGRGGSQRA